MLWLFRILRSQEWRGWPRWRKAVGVAILILLILLLINPDFVVFAGLFDVSLLDVLITLIGVQLLLYSHQIKALAHLAYAAVARRFGTSRQTPRD